MMTYVINEMPFRQSNNILRYQGWNEKIAAAKQRLEMAESWAQEALRTTSFAKELMIEANRMEDAAKKITEAALQEIQDVCALASLSASEMDVERKGVLDAEMGSGERVIPMLELDCLNKSRKRQRIVVSPRESDAETSSKVKSEEEDEPIREPAENKVPKSIGCHLTKAQQEQDHTSSIFDAGIVDPSKEKQPKMQEEKPKKSQQPSSKSRYNLTPQQKTALRNAIRSALTDPAGNVNPLILQVAVDEGIPKQSVLSAAAVASRRRRDKNQEDRGLLKRL